MSGRESDCKVYVGDLREDVSEKDLERAFNYYGSIKNIWIARNPPGFAFVEYSDPRDAEDAIDALDGSNIAGSRVKVEASRRDNNRRERPRDNFNVSSMDKPRRMFNPNDTCYECGERGHYAYDCPKRQAGGRYGGSRDHYSSRRRSRSRSRSYERRRSYSRSASRSRSR